MTAKLEQSNVQLERQYKIFILAKQSIKKRNLQCFEI